MNTESFDILTDVPDIRNRAQLKLWLKPLYIISDYMTDKETYNNFKQKMINIVRGCFCICKCREFPIHFKFDKKDPEIHELQLRHFIVNLIVWAPFVELNDLGVLNKDYILDCFHDIPTLQSYINLKLIKTLRDYHIKSTKTNHSISEVLNDLRSISIDYSVILGLSFSAPMFTEIYETIPRMKELMECTFDETMQPHEIEKKLNEFEEEEIALLQELPANHPLGVLLRANTGVKHKQLREFTVSEGLKPTLDEKTIPIPIENSTLLKGLDRPSYCFIDAMSSRKSLVTNKKVMGRAGYFGKIVLMLARTLSVSTDISDCNTKHLISYTVTNKKFLKKLDGRYYKETEDGELKFLNASKSDHLIGKRIFLRSPATCACGDKVCPRCVGKTAVINADISDGYAAMTSEEITKVINQSILSTKHLLTTNSEIIEFNPEFYKFFTLLGGEINPRINGNEFRDELDDYAIYINPDDVVKLDVMDNDSSYNTVTYRFYVRNLKTKEDILMQPLTDKELFLSDDTLEFMKKSKGLIHFKDIDDDTKLFEMVIMNNGLTAPLYALMNLLNKDRKDSIDSSIDEICQKFIDLMIESKIDANAAAAEMIVNRLIRDTNNIYERPDFTEDEIPSYEIFTVSRALEKFKAPLVGISFQNIKRQLLSDDVYTTKDGTSYMDAFYKTQIPTKNLKLYSKIMSNRNCSIDQILNQ